MILNSMGILSKNNSICIFYDADYPSNQAGGEKRLFMLSQIAINKGFSVQWVSFNFWKSFNFSKIFFGIHHFGILPKPKFYNKNGNRNKREPILYLINCFLCFPFFVRSKIWILGQWPMVHIFPLILLGLLLRKKIYVEWWETLENQWLDRKGPGLLGITIEYFTLKMASFVTFVVDCESEKEIMLKKNKNAKVVVIPNGVDIKVFPKSDQNYKFDFVSMCRLKNHKRVDLLIKATRKFIDNTGMENTKVAIIGDGPEKDMLLSLTKDLNLEKNITFFGFIENYNDAVSILLSSKVGILTTVAGGKGSVLISELFAAELPVLAIGSDQGIDPRYIKEGINGYITENISSLQLSNLMIKIIKDNEKLIYMKNKLSIEKKSLDWEKILKNHPLFC
tara:strand:+ start:7283 stop:8461 length:1179 start_codon:yes stop_codon:yes gene_type:complete